MLREENHPNLHLNIHHSDELPWTIQTVEASLLHQLTHNLISYLSEKGAGPNT